MNPQDARTSDKKIDESTGEGAVASASDAAVSAKQNASSDVATAAATVTNSSLESAPTPDGKDIPLASTGQTETAKSVTRLSRPIGKMPVEIRVELGIFEIDVNEMSEISPGKMLKLTSDCPGQVRLLCRDHEVGRGELVDIDGRLGVKILHNWCK